MKKNNNLKYLIVFMNFHLILASCVTFNLDLNNFNELPEGNWVARANGSWNNWGTGITLSDNDNNGIHTSTICSLENGTYEFVYAITGDFDGWSNWGISAGPPIGSECDFNPNDSWANYGFELGNINIDLQTHAWECCGINDCDTWEGCNSGQLNTDESYLYGRFEVRMKSASGDGLVSSFFTYNTNWSNGLGNLNVNEIDIEMTGNRDSSVQFTTHHPGDPNSWSYGEIIDVEFNPHLGFHDYAFEWTPNSIKWFVNNVEVYMQPLSIVDDLNLSQKIMMNLWSAIWEDWVGEWDNQDTPKHSYYDYVKYYSYSPTIGDYGSNNNFLFAWEDNFDTHNENIWDDNSSGSFNGNLCSFNPSNSNIYSGHLILSLTDFNNQINCNEITGDINNDNVLNVVDIVAVIEVVLNNTLSELSTCQLLASDINFDQLLNVSDIVGLVALILE